MRMQILAMISLALGILLSAFNWSTLFVSRDDRHVSVAPLVGGVLVAIGLLGFESTRSYWWLAILIDFGTLSLAFALPVIVLEMWAHSERNALYIFRSTVDDRTIKICLFRNGDSVIDISFDPPRPTGQHGNLAVSAGFVGKWETSEDHFDVKDYSGGRMLRIARIAGPRYTLREHCPDGDQPSRYSINGIDVDATLIRTKKQF